MAHLKEQVARARNEAEKFKEQVSLLQEECKVTRNNAKCTQSELEYKCEKLLADKNTFAQELQKLQEAANELQVRFLFVFDDNAYKLYYMLFFLFFFIFFIGFIGTFFCFF